MPKDGRVRTFILDDSPLVRDRLAGFLAAIPEVNLIGRADCSLFTVAVIRTLVPELLILDLVDSARNALETLGQLKVVTPRPIIVVLSEDMESSDRRHYRQAGADHTFAISTEFEAFLVTVADLARQDALLHSDRVPLHA